MMRNDQKVNVCPFGVILEPLVYINNTKVIRQVQTALKIPNNRKTTHGQAKLTVTVCTQM